MTAKELRDKMLKKYPSSDGWKFHAEMCKELGVRSMPKSAKSIKGKLFERVGVAKHLRYRITGTVPINPVKIKDAEFCASCDTTVTPRRKRVIAGVTLCGRCAYAVTIGHDVEMQKRLKL